MKPICIIMAHAGTEEICRDHLPLWKKLDCPIVFYCPSDLPIQMPEYPTWTFGLKGHNSPMANLRFKTLIKWLHETMYDWFIIFEYDAICLSPTELYSPANVGKYCGMVFHDKPDCGFEGTMFSHPPLVMDSEVLAKVNAQLQDMPNDTCKGFWDRMVGWAVQRSGVPVRSWWDGGVGYSHNTIEPSQYAEAAQAAKDGATLFHGVKNIQCLEMILKGSQDRK